MTVQHVLNDYDTLKHLAQFYLGNSNRWQEIVEFNRLSYPYIVKTREEKEDLLYGKGFVTIVRANYHTGATVKRGWTFKTKPYLIGGHTKTFTVTENIYIPPGVPVADIPVRSVVKGQFGNVSPDMINVPGEEFARNGVVIDQCTNQEALTGGQDINVLASGEVIYIPSERRELPPEDIRKMMDFIGGEDLELDEDGSLYEDGFGDLASVTGLDNIVQAINDRLMTERGDLPLHPEYGTNIPELLGQAQTAYTAKLVELDIYDALSYEDRITDVKIENLRINGTVVEVDLSFRLIEINHEMVNHFTLDYYENVT